MGSGTHTGEYPNLYAAATKEALLVNRYGLYFTQVYDCLSQQRWNAHTFVLYIPEIALCGSKVPTQKEVLVGN